MQRENTFSLIALVLHANLFSHGFNIRDISESKLVTNNLTGTAFGYSVALQENDENMWLLVGAPKYPNILRNGSSSKARDGAIYKCSLKNLRGDGEPGGCQRIVVESTAVKGSTPILLSNNFESSGNKFEELNYDDFDWVLHKGPTSSDQTGPSFDHTIQENSNGTYMLLEASHPRMMGETTMMATRVIPRTSGACIRFWYHMRGSSEGSLNVYIFTNSTGSRMIWSLEHDQGDLWHEGWVSVVPQEKYQIIFEGVVGQDYNSDIGLDDVTILRGACREDTQPGSGSLGMTLKTDRKTGQVLACAPTWMYSCKGQNHATGLCYLFDRDVSPENLQMLSPCRSSSCSDGQMDLVFLIDGSDSVNVLDFKKMLRWLSNVISSLTIGEDFTRVGVAQYSSRPRTEFHLNENYKVEELRAAVKKIKYLREATATGRAIDYISEEMFTVDKGMRPHAKHVAVVITDGKSQDDVIPPSNRAKAKGIILFAIGIGVAVESELKNISSDPDEQFVYSVNSYKALDGIRGQFQRKLYSLESQGSTFTTEQCQSGTAADFVDGKAVIGLPGLHDWGGGFAVYPEVILPPIKSSLEELLIHKSVFSKTEFFNYDNNSINVVLERTTPAVSAATLTPKGSAHTSSSATSNPDDEKLGRTAKDVKSDDLIKKLVARSYFGYSMSHGSHSNPSSMEIAVGAPRFESKGAVFLIKVDTNNGTKMTLVNSFYGGQMGSYFGFATCMTDMNNDGLEEVIIGAPMFLGRFEDIGLVEIYISGNEVSEDASAKLTLYGLSERSARFGFSVADAGDLNNDGYCDIIVGAPSYSDGDGAIYVYNGRRDLEKLECPSQILRSSSFKRQPVYFGFSLHGGTDVDGNGYPDIASGAPGSGNAFVMLSRPVIHVKAHLKSFPSLVNISQPSCYMLRDPPSSRKPKLCTTVNICFEVKGKNIPELVLIKFALTADVGRQGELVRAYFDDYSDEIGVLRGGDGKCSTASLIFKEPVFDVSTDVIIGMEYRLSDRITYLNDSALLNIFDENPVYTKVNLTRNCQNKNCETDLRVTCSVAHAINSNGSQSLTLTDDKIVSLKLELTNSGDDAYNVKILVDYHGGLFFSHLQQNNNCVSVEKPETVVSYNFNQSMSDGIFHNEQSAVQKQLWLKYSNPILSQNTPCKIALQFGILNQSSFYGSPLRISVEAKSSVLEWTSKDNLCSVDLPIIFQAKIRLPRLARDPLLPFSFTESEPTSLTDIGPNVSFPYFVENYGVAEIPSSIIKISWPNATILQQNILYLTGVECNPPEKCLCNMEKLLMNLSNLDNSQESSGSSIEEVKDLNATDTSHEKDKEEIWLTCSDDVTHCQSITCSLSSFKPSDMVKITLDFRIWEQTLTKMNVWKAHLMTTAEYTAAPPCPYVRLKEEVSKQQVTITVYNSTGDPNQDDIGPAVLKHWVIAIAAVVGVLILLLLMLAFYKVGFFESKYKQRKEESLEWRDFHQQAPAYEGRVHVQAHDEEDTAQHNMTTFQRGGH